MRFAALRRFGLRKTAVGLVPFVRFYSATFFCARKNAPHFSSSGAKKRRIQPERYMPFVLNMREKYIDKDKNME
jgi:hypothetical protein